MRRAAVLALALGACAWGDGDPFATLHAEIEAELATEAGRATDDGWQKLASGYELRLDTLSLSAAELELVGVGAAPAEDGHDHGGGEAEEEPGAIAIAHLPVPELELVAGGAGELSCEPSCDLPRGELRALRLEVGALRASGQVRDGGDVAEAAAFAGEVAFEPPLTATAALELVVDRDSPDEIELVVHLRPSAALFDELEWAALDGDPLALSGPGAAAAIADAAAAGRLGLEVEVHGHGAHHEHAAARLPPPEATE